MKTIRTLSKWWLSLLLGPSLLLMVLAYENPCVDSVSYGPWTCLQQGAITNTARLTFTNISVCVGASITKPVGTNISFSQGLAWRWEYHSCPDQVPNHMVTNAVTYTSGAVYFVPTIPTSYSLAGTYYHTGMVNGTASPTGACSILSNALGVVVITVTNSLPAILTQPVDQVVTVGSNATFSVVANGCPSVSYQWKFNGSSISGATGATLLLTNAQLSNAGNYWVTLTNQTGIVNSYIVRLSVVSVDRVIVDGSLPEIQGSNAICGGTTVSLRAMASPLGSSFPAGNPTWRFVNQPSGSSLAAPGGNPVSITPIIAGQYTIAAACGTSETNFILNVFDGGDANYDGISDCQELTSGILNWQTQLGSWRFDTPDWAGLQGQGPVMFTNLLLKAGWSIGAVEVNSNAGPAKLVYSEMNTNTGIANIVYREGSIRFWFRPSWTSGAGNGPKQPEPRLIEAGTKGTTGGSWGIYLNSTGTTLQFCTQTNATSSLTTNLTAAVSLTADNWYHLTLTYNSAGSALYLNGQLVGSGTGVANWPSPSVRSDGFRVGTDVNGTNWVLGRFDSFETFNYVLPGNYVTNYFATHSASPGVGTNVCPLAPLALNFPMVQLLTNYQQFYVTNGHSTGNFGWLDWNGNYNGNALADLLNNFNLATNFVDAVDGSRVLKFGSWIHGSSGGSVGQVSPPLTTLKQNQTEFGVVLWDGVSADAGANFKFQAAGYINICLVDFDPSGLSWIKCEYRGVRACDQYYPNTPPTCSILIPTNNQVFTAWNTNSPVAIPITAAASDPEDGLVSVAYYSTTDTNTPGKLLYYQSTLNANTNLFTYVWPSTTHGTNYLTAVATDELGASCTSAVVRVVVNWPPVVNAGSDQMIIRPDATSVNLSGSAADDGFMQALATTWNVVSSNGPVTFSPNASALSPTATFTTNGSYRFRLGANDGVVNVTSDTVVTVKERPMISIVSPANNSTLLAGTVTLNASAYDVDGVVTNVTFYEGPVSIGTAINTASNTYVLTWSGLTSGSHTIKAVAKDNDGLTNATSITILGNQGPQVNAGMPQIITLPVSSTTLSGNVTDDSYPTGAPITIRWSVVSSNGTVTFTSPTTASTGVSFATNGIYVLKLTADDTVFTNSSTVTITVNKMPVVSAGNNQVVTLSASTVVVTLSGSVSDDNLPVGATVTSVWSILSATNGNVVIANSNAPATTATFTNSGNYILKLSANDTVSTNSATVMITVNRAPVVSAGTNVTLVWNESASSVTTNLSGTATDDGYPSGTFTVTWSKISGPGNVTFSPSTAAATSATFSTNGVYVLQLAGNDGALSRSSQCTVAVLRRPFVTITSPTNGSIFAIGATITNTINAYDLDGSITNLQIFNGTNQIGIVAGKGFSLTGSAAVLSNSFVRLTPSVGSLSGDMWLWNKQSAAGGFDTTFKFQITQPGGAIGDGLTFAVQNIGPTDVAWAMGGSSNYAGVFYNTYWNWPGCTCPDVSGNSIGVVTNGQYVAQRDLDTLGLNLKDGAVHQSRVLFDGTNLNVWLDGVAILTNVPVPGMKPGTDSNGQGWFGFSAGTGGGWENHDIREWSLSTTNFSLTGLITNSYSFVWTNAPIGTNSVTAVAFDNDGLTKTSAPPTTVTVGNLTSVSVQLTSPTNGQMFLFSPTNILLKATASTVNGALAGVGFFNGSTLIGNGVLGTSNSYSFVWTNVAYGTYTVTARATNSLNETASHSISVTVNAMPTISITSPTNLQTFREVTNVTITATAADLDGSVTNVAFYSGTNFIGSDTTSPFGIVWNGRMADYYPITAVASDNRGASSVSDITVFRVTPTNPPPTVWITWPTNGSSFSPGSDLTITANATNYPAAVTNVEFYVNGELLGSDAASPYSITECCWKSGNYRLTAKAIDAYGSWTVSTQVNITIVKERPASEGFWDAKFIQCTWSNTFGYLNGGNAVAVTSDGGFLEIAGGHQYIGQYWMDAGVQPLWRFDYDGTNGSAFHMNEVIDPDNDPASSFGGWGAVKVDGTNIYVGGTSESTGYPNYIGGNPKLNVIKWSGTNWQAVTTNMWFADVCTNNILGLPMITAIEGLGGDLYVAGTFVSVRTNQDLGFDAETNIQFVAKFDKITQRWVAAATNNFDAPVLALTVMNGQLYAGGQFRTAGDNTNLNGIARLDGNVWTNLDSGISGPSNSFTFVTSLSACGSNLFVGGRFNTAGMDTNCWGVAKWDGQYWSSLGGGPSPYVAAIHISDYPKQPTIYSSGIWSGFDGYAIPTVLAVKAHGRSVYVGGSFNWIDQGSKKVPALNIAQADWNEGSQSWVWNALDVGTFYACGDAAVRSLAIREGSIPGAYDLLVGGDIAGVGSGVLFCNGLALWRVGIQPPGVPVVTITNPPSSIVYTNPDYITITATAFSDFTNIQPDSVFFYDNNAQISSSVTDNEDGSYTMDWWYPSAGLHALTAKATDASGLQGQSRRVYINVIDTNDLPTVVAVDDLFTVVENDPPTSLNVLANDETSTSNPLRILDAVQVQGNAGTLEVSRDGKSVIYKPEADLYGTDVFMYTVTDGVSTNAAYVTVKIRARPVIFLETPQDGQSIHTSSNLVVKGAVLDYDSGVTNVTVYVNNNLAFQVSPTSLNYQSNPTNFFFDWNQAAISPQTSYAFFSFNWSTNTAGYYSFLAKAVDSYGYTNLYSLTSRSVINNTTLPHTLRVTNGPSANGPIAAITNLISSTSSTYGLASSSVPVIQDGLFNLKGRASDPDGDPVAYAVLLMQAENVDPDVPEGEGTVFADVTPGPLNAQGYHIGGDVAGNLGTLDLTTVPDGVYDMVLRVRGGTDETNTIVRFQLSSQLKIGQFSFSEQDLVIPVSGIPLTVTRTYNSMNPREGAFGYNWSYALSDMDVTIDEERVPAKALDALEEYDYSDQNALDFSMRVGGRRDITLTLPDGRRVTFFQIFTNTTSAEDAPNCMDAQWIAPPGVTAKLTTPNPATKHSTGDNTIVVQYAPMHPYWQASGYYTPMEAYDFPKWILTTQDGTQYEITRDEPGDDPLTFVYQDSDEYFSDKPQNYYIKPHSRKPHLSRIVQRSGDSIQITDDGIFHYNATNALTRSVLFDRDSAGRITAIHDPNGGTNGFPAVRYLYNHDTGNLVQVLRLVDRNAGSYTTNRYHYDHPKFPHYITSIDDPRGIPIARNEYDDSGKLIAVIDANGKRTEFIHSLSNKLERIVDRLGNTNTYVYDLKGNVTAITNALGQVTLMAYNDPFDVSLKTAETNAFGTTAQSWTLFQYDENGNQTNIVDSLNRTNALAYDKYGNLLKAVDPLGNTSTNGYDDNGNLTVSAVLDANGKVLQKSVSIFQDGKLKESRDANNQLMASFSYDSMGNLTATADANNFTRAFGYDANGNQTNSWYVWVDGGGTSHYVTNRTEYDAVGRVTRSIDANGNTNQTFYTVNGKVDYTIDRFGNTNGFFYDARGNLVQATYPDGLYTRTVYNDDGKVYVTTDRNGVTGTRMEYDALGRVTNSVRLANVEVGLVAVGNDLFTTTLTAAGTILSTNVTVYDVAGRVKSRITTDGTTTYDYYSDGQLKSVTDALTNTTTYEYDPAGRQKQVVDALNRTNRFEYDAVGRAIKTIFADNSFTTNIFNELGQKVGEKDQANMLTQFTYNTSGQLTNVTKPAVYDPASNSSKSPVWSYKYDSYGRLTVTSDPLNHSTTNVYDALGRQVAHWLSMGQHETNIYNSKGQLWKQVDFKGQTLEFRYDQYGRVTNKYYFVVGQTQYPSNSVSYIYNQLGQMTNITERSGTDASSGYASLLPPGGNMLASTGWGSRVREAVKAAVPYSPPFAAFVLFCSILALVPGGRELCRLLAAYYLRGGWKAVLNRRGAEAQRFSSRRLHLPSLFWRFATVFTLICLIGTDPSIDRMWSAQAACTFPNNDSTSTIRITGFHYDLDGRLDEVNAPEGAIHYSYDLATGRLTSTCTKNSEVEYGYDALGRLKTVHVIRRNNVTVNETTTYTYTKVGSRETVTLPNGTVTTWQYDTLNRLTNLTHRASNNALLASYSYQLHPTGRRTNATEIVLNTDDNSYVTNTTTWWYDGMYRLTNEVTSSTSPTASLSHSTAYEYDLGGNRRKRVQGSETVTYQYNANDQLTNEVSSVSGATTYKYDENGSLTNKTVGSTVTSYTYNLANKLSSVMSGSTVVGSYQYNDRGIRVRKTEGSTTYYLVDANNHTGYAQVLEESASIGGAPSISYVLGDDVLGQCGSTTSDPGWFLYDGHGSTRQLVHSTVNVTSQFHYDAYGQSLTTLGTPETTMLYSGEQYDTTLGMYNLRARYYNPGNGRFNQRDTFVGNNEDPQSLHKYAYCHGDPINGLDPTGQSLLGTLATVAIIATIGALVGIAVNGVNNYATGKPIFENAGKAALTGALAGTLAYAFPFLGLILAGLGLYSAGSTAYQVFTNPASTTGQKAASALLIGLALFGSYGAAKNVQANGLWVNAGFFKSIPQIQAKQSFFSNALDGTRNRIGEFQDAMQGTGFQGRITMAVGVAEDASGNRVNLIGTSEPNGYVRPQLRSLIRADDVVVRGTGHAEADVVAYASANQLNLLCVGATRAVCTGCAEEIAAAGATAATPLKDPPLTIWDLLEN